jgi:hypothetical protein
MKFAIVFILVAFVMHSASAAQDIVVPGAQKDNAELERLFADDQSDRTTSEGGKINWSVVGARDFDRRKRVMEVYAAGELRTAKDFYHAGMVLQHGNQSEDYLLCHEFCVAAVFLSASESGSTWILKAKWLAAASHDRFLLSIGRGQRFGTQFTQIAAKKGKAPWKLDKITPGVSDELRAVWNVPTLAEAKSKEAELNKALR